MYSAIQHACQTRPGLNYLVPQNWYQQLIAKNRTIVEQKEFTYPPLNNTHLIDTFLLDMKQYIQDQFEVKCNYLKFDRVCVTSKPLNNISVKWRAIPPSLWRLFIKSTAILGNKNRNPLNSFQNIHPIVTFLEKQNQFEYDFQTTQLSIVYCSKTTCHLLVSLIPQKANLITVVRQIGIQMGFVQLQKSRINFPDKYPQKNYHFQQLQNFAIGGAADKFVMVFNMQRQFDDEQTVSHRKEQNLNSELLNIANNEQQNSNEAVAGDVLTMIDESMNRLNDGTLSTGAQTPFSFFGSQGYDLDRQYRVNQLFRDKKPEQVIDMKMAAKQAINGQLIMIPNKSLQFMQQQLDKMAQQILQSLHTHKKKSKEKQKQKQSNNNQ